MRSNIRADNQITAVVQGLRLVDGIAIRGWSESDFGAIQRLSASEGWTTPALRPEETLEAWRNSWPTLVATSGDDVVGFIRAISDRSVTTYIAELLVDAQWRGRGVASVLLNVTQGLFPETRLDLITTEENREFYERASFRRFDGFRRSASIGSNQPAS